MMTERERQNLDLVREYMDIAYTPGKASAQAVAHLCARADVFLAPSRDLPGIHTLSAVTAEEHGKLMRQVEQDLHSVGYDVIFAKDDRVCLRYTAEGSHKGEPHGDLQPTGRKAQWNACAVFRVKNGKLFEFVED